MKFLNAVTMAVPLEVASGGTNSTATPTAGAVAYGNGSSHLFTAAGTSGQVLGSNGAGAPTWQTLDLTYLPGSWAKKSVRAATTANITLSAPQTIDGIALVAGDRVLVKNQTTTAQNGIYVVAAAAWTRATDAATSGNVASAIVVVDTGTANGGMTYTTNFKPTDTIGTTAMNWYRVLDDSQRNVASGFAGLDANNSLNLNSVADANTLTGNRPALIIGSAVGQHLRIDNNEIISIVRDVSTTLPAGNSDVGFLGITTSTMSLNSNTVTVNGQVPGSVPFVVKGTTGQTANIFQVQSGSATNFFSVSTAGDAAVLGQFNAASGFFTGSVTASNLQDTGVVTSGILTISTGWTLNWQQARMFGPLVAATFSVTYTGATVTVPTNGDITNQAIGTLAAAYRPFYYFTLQNFAGPMAQFYVNSGGALTLSAVAPGSTLTNGTNYQCGGVWMTA